MNQTGQINFCPPKKIEKEIWKCLVVIAKEENTSTADRWRVGEGGAVTREVTVRGRGVSGSSDPSSSASLSSSLSCNCKPHPIPFDFDCS